MERRVQRVRRERRGLCGEGDGDSDAMKYSGAKYAQNVPFSKRKGEVYLRNRMKLVSRISDSDWVRAICIHEAAHIFYFRQFGATEFIYYGPRMDYIRATAAYDVQYAAVGPEPYTKKQMTFAEALDLEARLAVSGSVAAAAFTDLNDDGADDDFNKLEGTCDQLNINNHGPKFDAQALWEKARSEVEADFKSPENRVAIIDEAEKVRLRVFPWATLPIVDLHNVQNKTGSSNQP